jgi:serine/threonine-protein kinase RsbW
MTDQPQNSQRASHRFPNDADQIHAIENELLSTAERFGFTPSAAFALRLALDEAIRNAFVHGCCDCPGKLIDVSWTVSRDKVTITVDDHGVGFDPNEVPDPREDDNLERPCGRGLLLMRAYMTSIHYNEQGNSVTMHFSPQPQDD